MPNLITTLLVLLIVGLCGAAKVTVLSSGGLYAGGMAVTSVMPEDTLFSMNVNQDVINITVPDGGLDSVTILGMKHLLFCWAGGGEWGERD